MQQQTEREMTDYEQEYIEEVFGPSASTPAKEHPSPQDSQEKGVESGKKDEKEKSVENNTDQEEEGIISQKQEVTDEEEIGANRAPPVSEAD